MTPKWVALGSIAAITSGGTPSRKVARYWGGSIPWIKTAQIQNCRIGDTDVDEWITPDAVAESSARMVPAGSILMAMYGQGKTRGQVAILDIDATVNQACAAIVLRESVDRDYVFQQLLFRYEAIRALSNAGSQENLNADLIRQIAFPLPALHVQRAIAQLADEWDKAIDKTERLIAAKRRILDHIRHKLFVEGAEGWRPRKLAQVLREHGGTSSGIEPVYSVSVHKGLIDQIEHLGRSFAASDTSHYNLVRPGDVVYTKSPTGDFPYGVVKQSQVTVDVIVSPLYGVFTPASPDIGLLVDFYFESPVQSRNYLRPLVQKGAKNTIAVTNDGFLAGTVRLPCTDATARTAAALVLDARREIAVLAEEAAALRTQKRGLMQKLLTGQWHLPARAITPQEHAPC